MRPAPKLTPPVIGDEVGSYLGRFIREMNDLSAWIEEAVETIKPSKHLDDCPATGSGECNCGVEKRPA